jgi:hypothetical protein
MKNVTSKPELLHSAIETDSHPLDDWFDPIEDMIRGQVRGLIEEMIRGELDATLSRPRYGRRAGQSEGRDSAVVVTGHRWQPGSHADGQSPASLINSDSSTVGEGDSTSSGSSSRSSERRAPVLFSASQIANRRRSVSLAGFRNQSVLQMR